MPFRYLGNLRTLHGKPLYGTGECVDLIKALVPGLIGVTTQQWVKGASVKDCPGLARGTAIATFGPDVKFPRKSSGQHAAIFVAHAGAGIWVVEQYHASRKVIFHHMEVPRDSARNPDGSWQNQSKNPLAFSVIE